MNRKRLSIVRNEGTAIGRVNIGSVCQKRGLSRGGEKAKWWPMAGTKESRLPPVTRYRRGVKSGVKGEGQSARKQQGKHTGRGG